MRRLPRLIHRLHRIGWAVRRPLTLGVRALLIKGDQVLLVRHTYQPLWYLPGGGVHKHETLEQALKRELAEEIGAELGMLDLLGVYSSFAEYKSDHVVIYVCSDFALRQRIGNEIATFQMFPVEDLPPDISPGTRRRLEEYLRGDGPYHGMW